MTYQYVPADALRLAQIYLLFAAVARGIDYTLTPYGSSKALTVAEQALPLPVWGALFIVFGVMGLAGEVWMAKGTARDRWFPSYTAHSALLALYVTIAVGALLAQIVNEQVYGFRTAVEWLGYAVGHWVFVRRRKHAAR